MSGCETRGDRGRFRDECRNEHCFTSLRSGRRHRGLETRAQPEMPKEGIGRADAHRRRAAVDGRDEDGESSRRTLERSATQTRWTSVWLESSILNDGRLRASQGSAGPMIRQGSGRLSDSARRSSSACPVRSDAAARPSAQCDDLLLTDACQVWAPATRETEKRRTRLRLQRRQRISALDTCRPHP